jgi:uncharacterized protein YqgC (DUF456 family)
MSLDHAIALLAAVPAAPAASEGFSWLGAATITLLASAFAAWGVICTVLTVVGLPGTWMLLGGAVIVEALRHGTFSLTTLVIAGVIALLGELVEFLAGALGAKAQGASRLAGLGAIVGGLIGAVAGTVLLPAPIIGAIIGSAVGSGAGAAGVELARRKKTTHQVLRIGAGAFAGRLLATVLKGACALAMMILLVTAAIA